MRQLEDMVWSGCIAGAAGLLLGALLSGCTIRADAPKPDINLECVVVTLGGAPSLKDCPSDGGAEAGEDGAAEAALYTSDSASSCDYLDPQCQPGPGYPIEAGPPHLK